MPPITPQLNVLRRKKKVLEITRTFFLSGAFAVDDDIFLRLVVPVSP